MDSAISVAEEWNQKGAERYQTAPPQVVEDRYPAPASLGESGERGAHFLIAGVALDHVPLQAAAVLEVYPPHCGLLVRRRDATRQRLHPADLPAEVRSDFPRVKFLDLDPHSRPIRRDSGHLLRLVIRDASARDEIHYRFDGNALLNIRLFLLRRPCLAGQLPNQRRSCCPRHHS